MGGTAAVDGVPSQAASLLYLKVFGNCVDNKSLQNWMFLGESFYFATFSRISFSLVMKVIILLSLCSVRLPCPVQQCEVFALAGGSFVSVTLVSLKENVVVLSSGNYILIKDIYEEPVSETTCLFFFLSECQ
jgi:hypothetical protein